MVPAKLSHSLCPYLLCPGTGQVVWAFNESIDQMQWNPKPIIPIGERIDHPHPAFSYFRAQVHTSPSQCSGIATI